MKGNAMGNSSMYEEWILHWLSNNEPFGLCKKAVDLMHKEFPELTPVRGHVYCSWGKRGHWWLKTKEGEVVDPTSSQFPGLTAYEEYKEGDEVRLGSCMYCGESLWGQPEDRYHDRLCNDKCRDSYAAYLMDGT